jgi:hypothetical protein
MQPSNELAVLVKPFLKMFYGGGAIIGVLNVVFASPERFHRRAVHCLTQETCFGNEVGHGLAPNTPPSERLHRSQECLAFARGHLALAEELARTPMLHTFRP